MKLFKATIAGVALMCGLTASASGTITLQGTAFRSDTLQHYYIGPGVSHTHLCLSTSSRRVDVYAVTLDRADAGYSSIAAPRVEIGNDRCRNGEAISAIAKRKTTDTRQYIAGINGDFFITSQFAAQHEFGNAILGYPNMSCVIDGKLAAPDMIDIVSRENALIWDSEGDMWIDATDLTYKLLNNDGTTQVKAKAINYPMHSNEIMVYNSYMGASTSTAAGTREIALELADGAQWAINKSVKFTVKGQWSTAGNMAIPANGIVISCGTSYANEWIDGLAEGDVVKLKVILSLPAFDAVKPDVQAVIGGDVRILNSGNVTTEAIRWINTPSAKYSRSLVGYSQDRSRLVFAAVDAVGTSSGASYYESADLMAALGCYDALDLDGGGSTALWMAHCGFANKLRDGSERAVGNGLFITMDAPADTEVASIRFADHARTMPLFGTYKPVIYGYNKYGQLVDTDVKGIVLSANPEYAAIDDQGNVMVLAGGIIILSASNADGTMTALMTLTAGGSCAAEPMAETMIIDGRRAYTMPLQARVADDYMAVAAKAFQWESSDEGVATVDAEGAVTAVANGTATITGRHGDDVVAYKVIAQTSDTAFLPLDEAFDIASWKVTCTGIGADFTAVTDGDGVTTLDFEITSTRNTRMGLSNSIVLYGRPESLQMTVDTGDASLSNATISVLAADDDDSKVLSFGEISGKKTVEVKLSDYFDTESATVWPMTVKVLSLYPVAPATGKKCTIKLSDLGAGYDYYLSSVDAVSIGHDFEPLIALVDGELTVEAAESAPISIHNLQGRCLYHARGKARVALPGGIYIVSAGNCARKVVVR